LIDVLKKVARKRCNLFFAHISVARKAIRSICFALANGYICTVRNPIWHMLGTSIKGHGFVIERID